MTGRTTVSVSLKGDKEYIQTLGLLAKRKGVTIGELVREATDTVFGADLDRLTSAIFFAESGSDQNHSKSIETSTGTGAA